MAIIMRNARVVNSINKPAGNPDLLLPKVRLRSDNVVSSGSPSRVTSWVDTGSYATNWTNGGLQGPVYDTSGILPKLIFSQGSACMLRRSNPPVPSALTFILVANITSMGGPQVIMTSEYSWGFEFTGAAPDWLTFSLPTVNGVSIARPNSLKDITLWWDASLMKIRAGSAAWSQVVALSIACNSDGFWSIGAYGNEVYPCTMDVYEVLYWDRALSDSELSFMRDYISNRYGIL